MMFHIFPWTHPWNLISSCQFLTINISNIKDLKMKPLFDGHMSFLCNILLATFLTAGPTIFEQLQHTWAGEDAFRP
jgi:hypothetical protein